MTYGPHLVGEFSPFHTQRKAPASVFWETDRKLELTDRKDEGAGVGMGRTRGMSYITGWHETVTRKSKCMSNLYLTFPTSYQTPILSTPAAELGEYEFLSIIPYCFEPLTALSEWLMVS